MLLPHHLAADNGYLLYHGCMMFLANVRTFTQPPLGQCNRLQFYGHHYENDSRSCVCVCWTRALATPDKNFITLVIYMLMQSVKSRIEIELVCEIHIKLRSIIFDSRETNIFNNTYAHSQRHQLMETAKNKPTVHKIDVLTIFTNHHQQQQNQNYNNTFPTIFINMLIN